MVESRLALVTGGAKRVGRAIVEKLAADGFDIAFTYHNSSDDANALAAHLASIGRKCIPIEADLIHPNEAVAKIAAALDPFDRLDVLVNNASIYQPGSLRIHPTPTLSTCGQFTCWLQ